MAGKEAWKDVDQQSVRDRARCASYLLPEYPPANQIPSHSLLISTRTATMYIRILPTIMNYTSICYSYTNKNTTINAMLISNKSNKLSHGITVNGPWQGPA